MAVDPEEGLVTNVMLGIMIAFGADIVLFVGIGWMAGFFTAALFAGVTVLVVSAFALWIAWRWRKIKKLEATERGALEELKHRYASGEISEEEFERKLDTLVGTPDSEEGEFEDAERATENSK